MGKIDEQCRMYLSNRERFADAFNYLVYGGENVIDPELLRPCVERESARRRNGRIEQRQRDAVMLWAAMRDSKSVYAILGVEAQAAVDHAMAARCFLNDAMRIMEQVETIAAEHRRRRDLRQDEFVSGFGREDGLAPVVTLVLYLGARDWDGPESLAEMYNDVDSALLNLAPDYHLNLIVPARMGDGDFERFRTGLGSVLKYVKHSGNRDELRRSVLGDGRFRSVDRESAALINAVTGSNLDVGAFDEEGKVDMCKAIDDMRKEAFDEGRLDAEREMAVAIEEMRKEDFDEGRFDAERKMCKAIDDMRKEAFEEGRLDAEREMAVTIDDMRKEAFEEGKLETLANLVRDGLLPIAEAARRLGITSEQFVKRAEA